MSQPLRVVVVSRHPLIRAGLTHLLAADPARALVVDVSSIDGHLAGHDVVVYDLGGLVGTTSRDLQHLLAGRTPVLAVEPPHRPDLVEGALVMGVAEVVPLDVTGEELLAAVERVASGQGVTHSEHRASTRAALRESTGLTDRELDIVALIAAGLSNLDIADHLFLSINSIKTYIRSAYRKIGARSRSEAVLWAVRHRVVEQPAPGADLVE